MSVEGPGSRPQNENLYDRLVTQAGIHHRLVSVHWELTYRCNERCTHCYLDVLPPQGAAPGELSTEECLRVIDELAALGALNLTLSGGEILVRSDFFKIAEYARSKQFLLRLFTNGIRITPAIADRIAALYPYSVEVSLYSTHPELHDQITQLPNSWALTMRALRLLHERGVRAMLKTPLMRENVRESGELRALAEELGALFRYSLSLSPKDSGAQDPLRHQMTYDDLLWLFRRELSAGEWIERHVSGDSRTCAIALNALAIDPYGNVAPCVQVRRSVGNVRQQTLDELWRRSPLWSELGAITLDRMPNCRTCELQNLCVRCHGLAELESGDLRGLAWTSCRESLARRQVLIEKGALPEDYPIPAHLQGYARRLMRDQVEVTPDNMMPQSIAGTRDSGVLRDEN